MNALYDWLLHNTGNEGNYLTILNTQPHIEGEEMSELTVMARTKNFETVNLAIKSSPLSDEARQTERGTVEKEYQFDKIAQVTAYLSDGQKPDASVIRDKAIFFVYVMKPSDGSDAITFPPQQE